MELQSEIIVQSRGRGESSKGRGESGKGGHKGTMHPSAQRAITKKATAGQGKGRSLSELSSYVPSREASKGNSMSLLEEHNKEGSRPQGQPEPQVVSSNSHSTSQGSASTSHESNVTNQGSDSNDVQEDGRGRTSTKDDIERTEKKFTKIKGWIQFTEKLVDVKEHIVRKFYANMRHILKGKKIIKMRNLKFKFDQHTLNAYLRFQDVETKKYLQSWMRRRRVTHPTPTLITITEYLTDAKVEPMPFDTQVETTSPFEWYKLQEPRNPKKSIQSPTTAGQSDELVVIAPGPSDIFSTLAELSTIAKADIPESSSSASSPVPTPAPRLGSLPTGPLSKLRVSNTLLDPSNIDKKLTKVLDKQKVIMGTLVQYGAVIDRLTKPTQPHPDQPSHEDPTAQTEEPCLTSSVAEAVRDMFSSQAAPT
ncbi:uncharacterized protein [Nicotiana sylvestris]|uniref:uncharacterized protein n=1 Tax=Nicotiana sylvestris TaxID=4096 RepID=UPI00388CCC5D